MNRGDLDTRLLGNRSLGVLLLPAQPLADVPMAVPRAYRSSGDDADWAVDILPGMGTPPACVRLVEDGTPAPDRQCGPDVRPKRGGFGAMFQRVILEFALF